MRVGLSALADRLEKSHPALNRALDARPKVLGVTEALPERDRRRATASRGGVAPADALVPLRVFLGGTFVYAGFQKLHDPGFLHPGAPTYIGTQLHGFAAHTPGGFILRALALPHPQLAGVGVALLEIAIGLLVLAGLATRWAAAAGLGLNLLLFLTASWHVHPYFLGPDLVFAFAWLPLVLAGARSQPALDHELARRQRGLTHRRGAIGGRVLSRREMVVQIGALTGLGTLVLGGLAALTKGGYHGATGGALAGDATTEARRRATRSSASSAAPPPASQATTPAPRVPAGAVRLGSSSRLAPGQSALYRDPSDGSPDILIRDSSGRLTALSAVCTHAGCEVGRQGDQLVCPCHGAVFNARTGAVEQGPAAYPLPARSVVEANGAIYAVPS